MAKGNPIQERIEELKIENAKLNIILYHRENGLSHPDFNAEIEISKQAERIKGLEIDKENLRQYASGLENAQNLITVRFRELEALLEQLIWIAEKADTDDSEDTTIELAKQALKPHT